MSEETPRAQRTSLIDSPRQARRESKQLDLVEDFVLWEPTSGQKKAKARLLVALEDNPVASLEQLTCEQASRLGKYDFRTYWSQPGFRNWLTNATEFRQRVEHLANKALDAAEEILDSDDPRMAGAKVSVIAKVTELAAKLPKQNDSRMLDAVVANMGKKELEQFIRDNLEKTQLPIADFTDIEGDK